MEEDASETGPGKRRGCLRATFYLILPVLWFVPPVGFHSKLHRYEPEMMAHISTSGR